MCRYGIRDPLSLRTDLRVIDFRNSKIIINREVSRLPRFFCATRACLRGTRRNLCRSRRWNPTGPNEGNQRKPWCEPQPHSETRLRRSFVQHSSRSIQNPLRPAFTKKRKPPAARSGNWSLRGIELRPSLNILLHTRRAIRLTHRCIANYPRCPCPS